MARADLLLLLLDDEPETTSGSAVLAGTGTLTAAGTVDRNAAAAMAGAGTLAAVGTVERNAAAVLAGSSSLAPVSEVTRGGRAVLAGSSSMVANGHQEETVRTFTSTASYIATILLLLEEGVVVLAAKATLSGAAGVIAASTVEHPAKVVISGSGAVAGSGSIELAAQASLDGVGNLIAEAGVEISAAASLDGSSSLDAAGSLTGGDAVAALAGAGTLTATGTIDRLAAASLDGAGALTAAPILQAGGQAVLAGAGDVIANATQAAQHNAAAVLSGVGDMQALPLADRLATASMAGAGAMAAAGQVTANAKAVMAGVGTMNARAAGVVPGLSVLAGAGTMVPKSSVVRPARAVAAGVGNIIAASTIATQHRGQSVVAGAGTVTANSSVLKKGAAAFGGAGNVIAAGTVQRNARAVLAGAGTLAPVGKAERNARAVLSGAGTLTAAGHGVWGASAVLAGVGNVLAQPSPIFPISAGQRWRATIFTVAGNVVGSGPLTNIVGGFYEQAIDEIGSFELRVPASDPKVAELTARREVWLYKEGEGLCFKGRILRGRTEASEAGPVKVVTGSSIAVKMFDLKTGLGWTRDNSSLMGAATANLSGTGFTPGIVDSIGFNLTIRADAATKWLTNREIAKRGRVHVREDLLAYQVDFSNFGVDCGLVLRNVPNATPEMNGYGSVVPVAKVIVDEDASNMANRIYPLGGGEGINQVTLRWSDKVSPYVITSGAGPDAQTQYWIEDTASQAAYGLIEEWISIKEVLPLANSDNAFLRASNALYDIAAAYLPTVASPLVSYTTAVPGLRHLDASGNYRFQVGDKLRLAYRGIAEQQDGSTTTWLDVNTLLYLTKYRRSFKDGGDDWDLTVATALAKEADGSEAIQDAISSIRSISVAPKPYTYERSNGPYRDSVDAGNPLDFNVRFDANSFLLHKSRVEFRVKGLRANFTGAQSTSTTAPTSDPQSASANADGGHGHGNGTLGTDAIGAHRHQMWGDDPDNTQYDLGHPTGLPTTNPSHAHIENLNGTYVQNATTDTATLVNHAHYLTSRRVYVAATSSPTFPVYASAHIMMSNGWADTGTPPYTYTASVDHSHSATGSIASTGGHTHAPIAHSHSVTIPGHGHAIVFGITQQSTPGSAAIGITINGTDRTAALGGPWNSGQTLDITQFLQSALGAPLRQDNTIRITAAVLCDIEVEVHSMCSANSVVPV